MRDYSTLIGFYLYANYSMCQKTFLLNLNFGCGVSLSTSHQTDAKNDNDTTFTTPIHYDNGMFKDVVDQPTPIMQL